MMMPLMTPIKCPKCSGTRWSGGMIGVSVDVSVEGITPEEIKEILSKRKITSKRVEKLLVEGFERAKELQAQLEYVCESCGHILGTEG